MIKTTVPVSTVHVNDAVPESTIQNNNTVPVSRVSVLYTVPQSTVHDNSTWCKQKLSGDHVFVEITQY